MPAWAIEIGRGEGEHLGGTITTFEPPAFFRMDLHITQPSKASTMVEARFAALDLDRARVMTIQRNWDVFGADAKLLYGGYAHGWALIFKQAYRAACE
ncbi:MAG: hypothetical protein ACI9U2_005014 [Bradymonadia bacterium]|jgi:hypothetical protein